MGALTQNTQAVGLAAEELAQLATAEAAVSRYKEAEVDAAEGLRVIHAGRLYRAKYATFEEYLEAEWDWSRSHGDRLVKFAQVRINLSPVGDTVPLPTREYQVRAIASKTPPLQREIYLEAGRRAGGAPSGGLVAAVAAEYATPEADDEDERAKAFWEAHRGGRPAPSLVDEDDGDLVDESEPPDEIVARGRDEIKKTATKLRTEEQVGKREARTVMHREIAANNRALDFGDRRFSVFEADCPWQFNNNDVNGAAERHYPTMPTAEIADLPVMRHATRDAVLFLWATNAMLEDALYVMESWGFAYKTGFVWVKAANHADVEHFVRLEEVEDERHGTGWYNQQDHELLLLGVRGGNMTPMVRFPSVIVAPRGEHSAKPDKAYEMIEAMYPDAPRLGLFRRSQREGWECWGNQVEGSTETERPAIDVEAEVVPKGTPADLGWPVGVTRAEYKAWKEAQQATGVTENLNPREYKRQRDLGEVQPSPPAPEDVDLDVGHLKPPKGRKTPGPAEKLVTPKGKPVVLEPGSCHIPIPGYPIEVARYRLLTPQGREIGKIAQDTHGKWHAWAGNYGSGAHRHRKSALRWIFARDKYCGGTSAAQEEAREGMEKRYESAVAKGNPKLWAVADLSTFEDVETFPTRWEASTKAHRLNKQIFADALDAQVDAETAELEREIEVLA